MPKVSEAHTTARREQILDAARRCFARKGFHQTTTDDICREAEISPGSLYGYFGSKEEIIRVMGEEHRRSYRPFLDNLVNRDDRLKAIHELAYYAYSQLEKPDAPEVFALDIELYAEALRNDKVRDLMRSSFEEYRAAMASAVRHAQQRGEIADSLNPESMAQVGLSFFLGFVLQKALDPDLDVWKYVEVTEALVDGTAVPAAEKKGTPTWASANS
ncbi:MAG TPA: TetR/AcrR family transcriptional regulator [Dehalococcoidia bacterium]|nr:TetR/AcrR family transcriptional regulator [Dehalococcoidia bacterium]